MEIIVTESYIETIPKKDVFVLWVRTMTGDADDYHEFEKEYPNTEECLSKLKNDLWILERVKILDKKYDRDFYQVEGFEESFLEDYEWYSDEGQLDAYRNHSVQYFDKEGNQIECQIKLTDGEQYRLREFERKLKN